MWSPDKPVRWMANARRYQGAFVGAVAGQIDWERADSTFPVPAMAKKASRMTLPVPRVAKKASAVAKKASAMPVEVPRVALEVPSMALFTGGGNEKSASRGEKSASVDA